MEKRSINWKDPNVRKILDKFLDRTLGIKTIPEFANYINNFCGTNIALSTIRNRVYQEQRERKLLLQGRQQATISESRSSSVDTNLAPPDPEQPLNFLQAVPVMLNNGDGALMQAFALVGDTNPLLNFMSDSNGNLNQQTLLETLFNTSELIPGPSNFNSPPKLFPMTNSKSKEIKDSQIILVDEPLDEFNDEENDTEEISDSDEDNDEENEFSKPKKPKFHSLPIEFLQHFDSKSFKVDMGTLKQLSIFVREKLDYLTTATEIYPHHNSFMKNNIDAFKRNLDVIKQAGEYFEPLLSFENNEEYFPNSLSEMAIALTICDGNNTGTLDQFYEDTTEFDTITLENLPGCRLTKQGMLNLVIILNGILTEAEALIIEYEQMKIKNKKINKIKMMMLTLQFSRFYRLAGQFANAAIISNDKNDEKNEILSKELNTIKMIKNDPDNFFDDSEILPGTSSSFTNDWT